MDDLVEAMVRNSQALAEALAADRARREAADRIQRESWEAALKEKDAEIERLGSEAADAKRKLQADASKKVRWEAAYELLLGANQKLAELKDADMEDSRTCAETLNSKEVESFTNLSQNTMDHTASDFRKLKQAYETLSSKKDKEVSALLSEKDSLRSQLDIMQQDYVELLKNKKVEAAQATEAALRLQKSVDELKALAQKKDDEIGRLHSLLREKDVEIQRLNGRHPESVHKHNKDTSETHKKSRFGEIQRLKVRHPEFVLKHNKDISETHKKSRSGIIQRLKVQYPESALKHSKDSSETHKKSRSGKIQRLKGRRPQSVLKSLDWEMSGSDEEADEQSESDNDGDKQMESDKDGDGQSRSNEDGDEQSRSSGGDDDGQSRSDDHEHSHSGSDKETANNPILKPPGNHKRKRDACAETAIGKSHSESNGSGYLSKTKTVEKDGQENTTQKRRQASSMSNDDEKSGSNEDDDEQIGSDEDGGKQTGSGEDIDKQSGSNEDGGEQSGSGEDGEGEDGGEQSGSSGEDGDSDDTYSSEDTGDVLGLGFFNWWKAPKPLRQRKLNISNGQRFMNATGHWGQYIKAVNDSLVDQPDKHKEFVRFLRKLRNFKNWRVRDVARSMQVLLDGQPKLIRQFNQFLPDNCQIDVKEEEEQQPEVEEQHQHVVSRPRGQLPSASPSASAAAGLLKLKEAEQLPKLEKRLWPGQWCPARRGRGRGRGRGRTHAIRLK